jgi:hypothetical protein
MVSTGPTAPSTNGAHAHAHAHAADGREMRRATLDWAERILFQILETPFDPRSVTAADHVEAAKLFCGFAAQRAKMQCGAPLPEIAGRIEELCATRAAPSAPQSVEFVRGSPEWAREILCREIEAGRDVAGCAGALIELNGWKAPARVEVKTQAPAVEMLSQAARSPVTAGDQVAAIRLLAEMKGWIPPSVKQ